MGLREHFSDVLDLKTWCAKHGMVLVKYTTGDRKSRFDRGGVGALHRAFRLALWWRSRVGIGFLVLVGGNPADAVEAAFLGFFGRDDRLWLPHERDHGSVSWARGLCAGRNPPAVIISTPVKSWLGQVQVRSERWLLRSHLRGPVEF